MCINDMDTHRHIHTYAHTQREGGGERRTHTHTLKHSTDEEEGRDSIMKYPVDEKANYLIPSQLGAHFCGYFTFIMYMVERAGGMEGEC